MIRAQLLTPWAGDGASTPFRPAVADHHPLHSWVDVTGQPAQALTPDPNLLLIEATLTEETLHAIESDPRYGPGCVFGAEQAGGRLS